jgi:mediator of RNA polymerase II transcription subunit 17
MATYGANTTSALVFPHRAHMRLRVTLQKQDESGSNTIFHSRVKIEDESTLQGSLKAAQLEVVEQELFSMLVREASNLPTAPSRVSERLIVIEAAQNTELTFELVKLSFSRWKWTKANDRLTTTWSR